MAGRESITSTTYLLLTYLLTYCIILLQHTAGL